MFIIRLFPVYPSHSEYLPMTFPFLKPFNAYRVKSGCLFAHLSNLIFHHVPQTLYFVILHYLWFYTPPHTNAFSLLVPLRIYSSGLECFSPIISLEIFFICKDPRGPLTSLTFHEMFFTYSDSHFLLCPVSEPCTSCIVCIAQHYRCYNLFAYLSLLLDFLCLLS